MATQVVMFSVLLFGMSGVVLDFGRVYSEHSRMQAFTDQAALAAAEELDGRPDAIARAIDAVFTDGGEALLAKDGIFSTADGRIGYNISHLYFVKSISDETGPQYALGDDLKPGNLLLMVTPDNQGNPGDAAMLEASTQAKYVIAVGEERSVRNTLLRLINSTSSAPVGERQRIRTISAAKHVKLTCGPFSNLVVCNPWENDPARSLQSELENPDNIGIHFRHVADGTLSLPNSLARRIDTQLQGQEVVKEICNDPLYLPGYDVMMTPEEVAHARIVCMLAAAEPNTSCTPDSIPITPATADEIVTSLDTAFDMWDAPIAGVLEWDRDADGNHSQHPDYNPATAHLNQSYSSLFQPDLNIMKGRIWNEELAVTNLSDDRPLSSRLNFPPIPSVTDQFNLIIHKCVRPNHAQSGEECLTDSTGTEFPWISQPVRHTQVLEYYAANFAHQTANVAEFNFGAAPTEEEAPNYATASAVEMAEWHHAHKDYTGFSVSFAQGEPLTLSGEDASLTIYLDPPNETVEQDQKRPAYDEDLGGYQDVDGDSAFAPGDPDDVEQAYSRYTYNIGGNFIDNDRRLINVTMVNCGSARTAANGQLIADVVGFAELYLLTPPAPECPDGSEDCLNRDLVSASVYSEFVQAVAKEEEEHYAVLVR